MNVLDRTQRVKVSNLVHLSLISQTPDLDHKSRALYVLLEIPRLACNLLAAQEFGILGMSKLDSLCRLLQKHGCWSSFMLVTKDDRNLCVQVFMDKYLVMDCLFDEPDKNFGYTLVGNYNNYIQCKYGTTGSRCDAMLTSRARQKAQALGPCLVAKTKIPKYFLGTCMET